MEGEGNQPQNVKKKKLHENVQKNPGSKEFAGNKPFCSELSWIIPFFTRPFILSFPLEPLLSNRTRDNQILHSLPTESVPQTRTTQEDGVRTRGLPFNDTRYVGSMCKYTALAGSLSCKKIVRGKRGAHRLHGLGRWGLSGSLWPGVVFVSGFRSDLRRGPTFSVGSRQWALLGGLG